MTERWARVEAGSRCEPGEAGSGYWALGLTGAGKRSVLGREDLGIQKGVRERV